MLQDNKIPNISNMAKRATELISYFKTFRELKRMGMSQRVTTLVKLSNITKII